MKNHYRGIRQVFLAACLVCLGASSGPAQRPRATIGIVIDGPWERNEEIRKTFEREITQLLRAEYDVRFPDGKRLRGDWTAARVEANLEALLADPEVDAVIAMGVLSSLLAGRHGELPKPVIAPFVIDPELESIPFEIQEQALLDREYVEKVRVSGVPNLSYVVLGDRATRESATFREVVPFTRLTILTMRALVETVP